MTGSPNPIDELHDRLFTERPKKRGTRFERIAALVFAVLNEGEVRHQVRLRGRGRRAQHFIDVDIRRGGGTERAIVECKHWREVVDQDVVNSVVGRRVQLGADEAIVVSTAGFTQGALDVAHDEHVRLVRIHPLAEDEHWHGVLKEIRLRGTFVASDLVHLRWRAVDPEEARRLQAAGVSAVWDEDRDPLADGVEHEDGRPAERVADLLARHPSPWQPGEYSYEVALQEPRFLRLDAEHRIAVRALEWTERVSVAQTSTVIGPPSAGRLLVEELMAEPNEAKRVVMDHELRAWQIAESGHVLPSASPREPRCRP